MSFKAGRLQRFFIQKTMKRFYILSLITAFCTFTMQAQQLKYADFDQWITRQVKESAIIGGHTVTLNEIAPGHTWDGKKPYVNQGGSPWATSNVMAKVAGVVKTNVSVYPEARNGGQCAKMLTHVVGVKVLGLVNIYVMAAGSVYLGQMREPITSSSNPYGYLDYGIPFNEKPKAIELDYKVKLSGKKDRVRQTGFSPVKTVAGMDMPGLVLLLQRRWEDKKGNIYAHRIGTIVHRFSANTGWVNKARFEVHYGDITSEPYYKSYMKLQSSGDDQKYALNSKGKMVKVTEVAWGSPNDTPTHLCLQFASSFGTAYVGAEGTTFWVDNVHLIY